MPYIFLALVLLALATGFAVWHGGRGTKGEFAFLLVLGTKVDGESPGKMLRDRINAAGHRAGTDLGRGPGVFHQRKPPICHETNRKKGGGAPRGAGRAVQRASPVPGRPFGETAGHPNGANSRQNRKAFGADPEFSAGDPADLVLHHFYIGGKEHD